MNEIENRLLEAIEHPERFSDTELEELMGNPEASELYRMLSRTSDALTPQPQIDTDAEWQRFAAAHSTKKLSLWRKIVSRPIAAILVIGLATLAVVAATIGVTQTISSRQEETAVVRDKERTLMVLESEEIEQQVGQDSVKLVIFKDVTISEVLSVITKAHGAQTVIEENAPVDIRLYFRWNPSQSLNETVNQLNSFDKINITLDDNTLILH